MILYIVGPVTGNTRWKKTFSTARAKLIGHDIILTPMDYPEGLSQKQYMQMSVTNVFICDAIICLWGWENSPGAKAEVALALSVGKPVHTLYSFLHGNVHSSISVTGHDSKWVSVDAEGRHYHEHIE